MKKRIGTLYNKIIIEGDINLKTPNEIHKNELKRKDNSNGGDSINEYAPRYFKIDWEKADENWKYCLFEIPGKNDSKLSSTTKIIAGTPIITAYNIINIEQYQNIVAFSYNTCIYADTIVSFEFALTIVNNLLSSSGLDNISMNGITEISEYEYYKVD